MGVDLQPLTGRPEPCVPRFRGLVPGTGLAFRNPFGTIIHPSEADRMSATVGDSGFAGGRNVQSRDGMTIGVERHSKLLAPLSLAGSRSRRPGSARRRRDPSGPRESSRRSSARAALSAVPRRLAAFRAKPDVMYVEARKKLVEWLRRQLTGPAGEGGLRVSPIDRYPTGVLHPVEPDATGIDPASTVGDTAESHLHDEVDEDEEAARSNQESEAPTLARPARRRRYVPPSSVGFSCYVRGRVRLVVTATAAVYRVTDETRRVATISDSGVHPGRALRNPRSPGREPPSPTRRPRRFGKDAPGSTFVRDRIETAASLPSHCATEASWTRTHRHARESVIG